METGIVAIVAAAIGAAVGAIIEQLGGWANDHIKLRRAKIQNKIAEEQAKTPQAPADDR